MNISTAINIKKQKLSKGANVNKHILRRLERSIDRHQKEMRKMQRRRRLNRRKRAKFIKRRH
jgi:hypothetical protein